jgi:hypothetical protein
MAEEELPRIDALTLEGGAGGGGGGAAQEVALQSYASHDSASGAPPNWNELVSSMVDKGKMPVLIAMIAPGSDATTNQAAFLEWVQQFDPDTEIGCEEGVSWVAVPVVGHSLADAAASLEGATVRDVAIAFLAPNLAGRWREWVVRALHTLYPSARLEAVPSWPGAARLDCWRHEPSASAAQRSPARPGPPRVEALGQAGPASWAQHVEQAAAAGQSAMLVIFVVAPARPPARAVLEDIALRDALARTPPLFVELGPTDALLMASATSVAEGLRLAGDAPEEDVGLIVISPSVPSKRRADTISTISARWCDARRLLLELPPEFAALDGAVAYATNRLLSNG